MLDSNWTGSEIFVVDAAENLHRFLVSQNSLTQYGKVSLPRELTPADMAYGSSEGQEFLLIAGTESGHGVVVSYSLEGKPLRSWKFRNICSGIDFPPKGRSAYVATSDSNEIYRVDVHGAKITSIARIENATKLGPVAFDEGSQQVYVADVASGQVYQYSLASKISKVLVTGLSAPTALAFDPDARRLFIADPGRRGVFMVDTRSSKPVAVEFAPNSLKAPYGMTVISNDHVAVADYGANSVVVLSVNGTLLFRYPPSD